MLRESYIGHNPSHFQINKMVMAFIIADTFLWSAWNFVTPIFAIFAATKIDGGNVQIAASSFSTYLVVRVIFELVSGRYLSKASEFEKFITTIIGMLFISVAYLGFAFADSIVYLFLFYGVAGLGLGIATPPKTALFSTHLDRHKEIVEWSVYDAIVLSAVAFSSALGGFIAGTYGFKMLFILASAINFIGIIPYILYIHKREPKN
ncbi:MAG: MFS transporter [Patescibacteria group bacterium]|nr:MFS transporter [Patescibacteria group bacterium]